MSARSQSESDPVPDSECIESKGPWPFVTRRVYQAADQSKLVWTSRHHRKGLLVHAARKAEEVGITLSSCFWMPQQLNWWIATVFAVGSLLFALASILSLAPSLAEALSLDSTQVNAIFFVGSIPFTIAAYLQLFQAANAGDSDAENCVRNAPDTT
jgi:hypothetical protein